MITILGSTGTIGINALSIISKTQKKNSVFALTANRNDKLLFSQIKKYLPLYAVLGDENEATKLSKLCSKHNLRTKILNGSEGLIFVSNHSRVKTVLSAIVGAAALKPTFAAVESGKKILLANKESLIMSGPLMIKAAKKSGAMILPVDSEHNAILQIITTMGLDFNNIQNSKRNGKLNKITLTASGGPFLNFTKNQLSKVTPSQAIKHPKWKMGKKISVDSASMMNKGLEIIEAAILFNLKPSQIDILIHPQSIVHALVSFTDGSVISHMSNHDMRVAISYALSWPKRYDINLDELKLSSVSNLTFKKVRKNEFKCLDLCLKALKLGNNAPTVLNAANEVAVEKFLENKIKFIDIPVIIEHALNNMRSTNNDTLKKILACDQLTRDQVSEYIRIKWK